jgi:hypothetical protein
VQNSINEETIAGVVGWSRTVGRIPANNFAVDLYEPGGEVHGRVTPRAQELQALLAAIDRAAITSNLWGVGLGHFWHSFPASTPMPPCLLPRANLPRGDNGGDANF